MKKILAVLLCVVLLCPLTVFAEEFETAYFEMAEYNEPVSFLAAIGTISRDDVSLDTQDWTISRGEFVRLAIKALGQDGVASSLSLQNPFVDVAEDYEFAKALFFAAQSNLLGAETEKFFRPEQPLDMELAARLGVCMTGRDILVRGNKTYLGLATEAHMFDDVEIYNGNKISRGGALKFLKNVLTTDLVTVESIGSGGQAGGVQIVRDKTILSSVLNLEKRRGIVTADGITTVMGEEPQPGYITIDGEPYLSQYANTYGLAGKVADYYVTDHDGIPSVRYIEEWKNSVLTLDSKTIQNYDPVNRTYQVTLEGKTKSLNISLYAYVAYNFEPDYDPVRMKPAKGTVTLIDHADDGVYDAVLIQEFTNTVVDTYSSYSETIYDIKDSNKNADLSAYETCSLTNQQNVPVDPMGLEKFTVVTVYKSATGNKGRMIVSTVKKSGKLSGIDSLAGTCTVGEQSYRLSKDIRFDSASLVAGETYTFYFDALGEIAYAVTDSGTMAYLMNAKKGTGLSDEVVLQLLPEDTQTLTAYNLAEKVRIKTPLGEEVIKRSEVYSDILFENGAFKRGMSLISLNQEGEVNSITTAMEIDTYEKLLASPEYPLFYLSYLNNEWPDILGGPSTSGNMEYQYTIGGFARWIIIGSGAQMFYVPPETVTSFDADTVIVRKISYSNGNQEHRNLQYYSKDLKDVSVRYMVNSVAASSEHTEKQWPHVITDIVQCYSDKLGTTYRLKLNGAGSEYSLMLAEENLILTENLHTIDGYTVPVRQNKTMLEIGDIVSFAQDGSGNICSLLLMWDAKANIDQEFNDNGDTAPRFGVSGTTEQSSWNQNGWRAVPGNLVRKYDNAVEIVVDKTETMETQQQRLQRARWGGDNVTYMIDYSGKEPKFTKGVPINELVAGDRIVFTADGGRTYMIVAYRR